MGRSRGDSGENMLKGQEQAGVLSLKPVNQCRDSICAQFDQFPGGDVTLGGIRKLGDEPFCSALHEASANEPVHGSILHHQNREYLREIWTKIL